MNNPDELVSVGTHLTSSEANEIVSSLRSLGIEGWVQSHNVKTPYAYTVNVKRSDAATAQQLVRKKNAEIIREKRRCPGCKHETYTIIEKQKLWEKIFYAGTLLVQCNKCKKRYPV